MPDLSRRLVKIDATTTEPESGSADPFDGTNETTALRMGAVDDFEEEVETSEDSLGRPVDVGRAFEQSYFIREDSAGSDSFISFMQGQEDPVWVKETYQEQGGSQPTKIVGAPNSGAVVYTAEATVDGLKGTMITVTTTSVTEAANYRDEPSYS